MKEETKMCKYCGLVRKTDKNGICAVCRKQLQALSHPDKGEDK